MVAKKVTVGKPKTEPELATESTTRLEGFSIAGELVRARTKAGISQSQLSERAGVARNTLMGYESGRNKPGARELKSICEVLGVTPNKLLFGRENPFNPESLLDEFGFDNEDRIAALVPILLKMLPKDEQNAVFTLIHGLIEARHGKKVIDATVAMVDELVATMTRGGADAVTEDVIKGIGDRYEHSVRTGNKAMVSRKK